MEVVLEWGASQEETVGGTELPHNLRKLGEGNGGRGRGGG